MSGDYRAGRVPCIVQGKSRENGDVLKFEGSNVRDLERCGELRN